MIACVLVEVKVSKQDQVFDYLIPSYLEKKIKVGMRVSIPFNNKLMGGFILGIENKMKQHNYKLKEIHSILEDEPILNEEMISLGRYMSETCYCSLISCFQIMLPMALKARKEVKVRVKEEKYLTLNKAKDEIKEYIEALKNIKQKEILIALLNNNYLKKKDLKAPSSIKTLLTKGLIKEEKQETYRLPDNEEVKAKYVTLTDEQEEAMKEIINGSDKVYLLHGVTGSGKTEVYLQVIKDTIKKNKTAIVLVPEIALTTQLVDTFKGHFGNQVAILHSRLSDGERYDEWRRINRGEVSIVIGARSAVFAPLTNIGIIIIDEEHESTYKQENNPRYNAIEIAIYRANTYRAKVVLGSATPSLESYARAKKGIYKLLELKERINKKPLPKVMIIDMKDSMKKGYSLFSKELIDGIKERLDNKEQIMILLNRRGYAHYLSCKNCGYTYKCPNCDITLTYHKSNDTMRCHYCGYAENKHMKCPSCHSESFSILGAGTEKIEEEIEKLFPTIRIVRMDLDTTTNKGSHSKIIRAFNEHKYDLLLGTQIIAKGLDFSKVTLVGIINGDMGLNIPDFRSGERTFQLLSQVAGRSGRSDIAGEVILQTYNPEHYVMQMVKDHDYTGFYTKEMAIRRKLNYPPYSFILIIRISSKDYEEGYKEAKKIGDYLRKNLPNNNVLGPTVSALSKINKIYRFQCLIKYRHKEELEDVFKKVMEHYENNHKIKVELDFNPLKL